MRQSSEEQYVGYVALPPQDGDLLLPLADLPGVPSTRLVAVMNGGTRAGQVTISYYDTGGQVLERQSERLAAGEAHDFRGGPATGDTASILVSSDGLPLAAVLLQSPG
jgi:hypothetical protein